MDTTNKNNAISIMEQDKGFVANLVYFLVNGIEFPPITDYTRLLHFLSKSSVTLNYL